MSTLTVRTKHFRVKWKLDAECLRTVGPIAREFGMSVERFLTLFTMEKLPAQLPNRDFAEEQDQDINLQLDLPSLARSEAWPRLERAAKSEGMTVEEFLTEAILEDVRAAEEEMILSPKTGQTIAYGFEIRNFIVEENHWETCEDGGS
jgi:hypothetical protein